MTSLAPAKINPSLTFGQRFLSVWPAVILIVCFLFPPELAINAGPLRLGFYRIALLALSPVIFAAFLRGNLKLHSLDFLMIIVVCWLPLSFAMNYNWAVGLESGGAQAFDMILGYFLGRATIRSLSDLRNFLICILPAILLVGLLMAAESLSGELFVREFSQSVFGGTGEVGSRIDKDYRQGLLRAYSVFTHPIHGGLFLSSFIALYYMNFKLNMWRYSGVFIGLLGFFSLSSAAVIGIISNIIILFYDWFQKRVRDLGWPVSIGGLIVILAAIHFFSQSGVISVIYRYLTFNSGTGYYRTLIWQYAGADAWRHPWFGLGYEEYSRPLWMGSASIDAHYLFMATSYGLVPALLYFLMALFVILILSHRVVSAKTTVSRNAFFGMVCCYTVIVTLLFTVTFWGAMLSWFNFTTGFMLTICTISSNLSEGARSTSRRSNIQAGLPLGGKRLSPI